MIYRTSVVGLAFLHIFTRGSTRLWEFIADPCESSGFQITFVLRWFRKDIIPPIYPATSSYNAGVIKQLQLGHKHTMAFFKATVWQSPSYESHTGCRKRLEVQDVGEANLSISISSWILHHPHLAL